LRVFHLLTIIFLFFCQITRDIFWFCVILLTLIVSFGQMFFTLLAPKTCSTDETYSKQECAQSEYYLKVYAILLGDFGLFERQSFKSIFSLFLAVFYTFMVVIVLLNVLIAVASDSYEKCLIRSHNLFGRARVMMIAELVSFQNLLRRSKCMHSKSSTSLRTIELEVEVERLYEAWWWSYDAWAKGWSRGSVVFFTLSFLVITAWALGEVCGHLIGERYGNIWMSLGSVSCNVILYIGIMTFLSRGAVDTNGSRGTVESTEWYQRYFQKTMARILGSSGSQSHNTVGVESKWNGRLSFLCDEMKRISKDATASYSGKIHSLESRVQVSETRLRNEIVSLEKTISSLRCDIVDEMRCRSKQEERELVLQQQMSGSMAELLVSFRNLEQQVRNRDDLAN
jgi:hypothetical protein